MKPEDKIYVAGFRGLVGSALVRQLKAQGFRNILVPGRVDLDLTNFTDVKWWFSFHKPKYVFLAAAKVGGIVANREAPADFISENLAIQANVIESAHIHGVEKLLFFGSACAYPKHALNPIKEEYLLTGELEPTNRAYAIAKIAGIEMCDAYRRQHGDNFISCMPTNLYGLGDHYDLNQSHVLPGMIARFHAAKIAEESEVTLWGSGKPTREFLYSDDLARAAITLMQVHSAVGPINIGTGEPAIHLHHLAEIVSTVVGFNGEILWDTTKPDGTPHRTLDSSRILAYGWKPRVELFDGVNAAYLDYKRI